MGCPSLSYVYEMTWAEFQIRSFAYRRKEIEDWKKVREIAYSSLIAPHQDPKHIPRSRSRYINLEGLEHVKDSSSSVSDETKVVFLDQYKEYIQKRDARITDNNRS